MVCKPADGTCAQIVVNVADLGHSGYVDGECVIIKGRRGVCYFGCRKSHFEPPR